jgi:hypothetical protein
MRVRSPFADEERREGVERYVLGVLKKAGRALDLQLRVVLIAMTYIKRFWLKRRGQAEPRALVASSLFLAAKIEHSVSLRKLCSAMSRANAFWSIDEDSVIEFELQLLGALEFELCVFLVHDQLIIEARELGAHVRVIELAWAIATELYTTDTVLAHAPRPVARAALAVAYAQLRRDGVIPEALTSTESDRRALADAVSALRRRAVALGELGSGERFRDTGSDPIADAPGKDAPGKGKRGGDAATPSESDPAESPGTASVCSANGSAGGVSVMDGSRGSSASLWRSDSFASMCCAALEPESADGAEIDVVEAKQIDARRLAEKRERAVRAANAERAAVDFLGSQSIALGRSIRKETTMCKKQNIRK